MRKRAFDSFDALVDLMRVYASEAKRCEKQRAYLAGSILYGAALEAALLAMAKCYPSRVRRTQTYQRQNRRRLDKWSLDLLLKLGRELKWIPSRGPIDEIARRSGISWDKAWSSGDLGYLADAVREIRDMVHPGRYIRLWKWVKITKGNYEFCDEVVRFVFDYLRAELEQSVLKSLENVPVTVR